MTAVECTATGWLTGYGSCALHCLSQLVCATYLGPLHTRAKSRDHEIVRAQKKVPKGRPNTPPNSCSVVTHPQV